MIINSLCDTDFYILTQMQAIFHRYTNAMAKFEFKWRNWEKMEMRIKVEDFVGRLKQHLDGFCTLRFTKPELGYLGNIPFLAPDFIEYLRLFQPNRDFIHPYVHEENGQKIPAIEIYGPLLGTTIFEVPTLAMVSQLYTENCGVPGFNWLQAGRKNLHDKLSYLDRQLSKEDTFKFADFGTRRRAHKDWHSELLQHIMNHFPRLLSGTSNVMFAQNLGLPYIGTMAHFWFQIHQQIGPRLIDSQKAALQAWADEYRGELGIALSDIEGFESFLKDFDRYFALLFDGCRQDSGDPQWWVEKLIAHYKKLRIDPMSKKAIFSDGLSFEKALRLYFKYHLSIQTGFGIGTYLTNDCGFLAPQIVIKNVEVNGKPTAKISDSTGKGMCKDADFEAYFKKVIDEKVHG